MIKKEKEAWWNKGRRRSSEREGGMGEKEEEGWWNGGGGEEGIGKVEWGRKRKRDEGMEEEKGVLRWRVRKDVISNY